MHGMHSDAMNSNYIVFQSFYVLENRICSVNLQTILNHNTKSFLHCILQKQSNFSLFN